MDKKNKVTFGTIIFSILSVVWISPLLIVWINSFKKKTYINKMPFRIPTGKAFVGFNNYVDGIRKIGFFRAFGYSVWITVASVAVILLCTSMFSWYIIRVKTRTTTALYYLCAFSNILPPKKYFPPYLYDCAPRNLTC